MPGMSLTPLCVIMYTYTFTHHVQRVTYVRRTG